MRFVGRVADLDELEAAWAAACNAQSRLLVLRGAAGIGKTTLLREFISSVTDATVLYGAGHEHSSLPYLSIGAALRPLWEGEPSPFDRFLHSATAVTPLTPSELRLDLVLDIAGRLIDRAKKSPVLLVIDDAHWADSATVELLGHLLQSVSAEREPLSLLVVLAMRPVGGDAPAARLVERARREPSTQSRDVPGLDLIEVDEFVRDVTGHRPSRPLLRALHTASGGNPLLVRSLLNRLEAFGGVAVRGDVLVQTSSAELLASPHDLDQLLRDRLINVTETCRRVLVVGAFLGDDTSIAALAALSGLDAERFDLALDEAQQAGLLDADDDHFRFDHPQLRQVLYQSLRGRRRAELHIRIADHLEASSPHNDPMTSMAIAHHLRHARNNVDPHRVERWTTAAARVATDLGAWAEAADLYEAALEALTVAEPEAHASRALLESRAALAHWYNHDNGKARAHAEVASHLAKDVGDLDLWAGALEVIARTIWAGTQQDGPEYVDNLWRFDEFLAAAGTLDTPAVAKVCWVTGTLRMSSDLEESRKLLARAVDLNRSWSDVGLAADLALSEGGASMTSGDFEGAIADFTRSEEHAAKIGDRLRRAGARSRRAIAQRMLGHLTAAEEGAAAAAEDSRASGLWAEYAVAEALLTGVAAARGDTVATIEHGKTAQRFAEWSGFGQAAVQAYPALAWGYAVTGNLADASAALDALDEFDPRMGRAHRPLLHALKGERELALRSLVAARRASAPLVAAYVSAIEVEVVDRLDVDVDLGEAKVVLSAMAEMGLCFLPGWPLFIPRLAGVAAARSGDRATADRWFQHATAVAERVGAEHELALLR